MLFQCKNPITTSQHVKYLREVIFCLFMSTRAHFYVCVLKDRLADRQTNRGPSIIPVQSCLLPSLKVCFNLHSVKGYTGIRIFLKQLCSTGELNHKKAFIFSVAFGSKGAHR